METFPPRESGIVRAVTGSPEQERAVLAGFAEALKEQPLSSFERRKTREEEETIEEILLRVPEFVSAYGGQPVSGISPANFHFADVAKLPAAEAERFEEANVGGFYDFERQAAVIFPEERSALVTAQRVLHELMHFEGFAAMQPQGARAAGASSDAVALVPRRIGFSVFDAAHSRRFFRDVDEAIIEMLAARFDERHFGGIPALASDLERRQSVRGRVKRAPGEIAAVFSAQDREGRWETVIAEWRYKEMRERLNILIGEIHSRNRPRFASEDEVFALFARAVFTGRLLEVARIVESTFGPGSFRKLGEDTMLGTEEGPREGP
jgi:hypothetical protein